MILKETWICIRDVLDVKVQRSAERFVCCCHMYMHPDFVDVAADGGVTFYQIVVAVVDMKL